MPPSQYACRLEREVHAAAHHADVIVRPVHHGPTEVVYLADARHDANFDAAAKLANCLGRTIAVCGIDGIG